ncbi:MAG: AAA family ATPase, partial [Anaerolineales bacterium]|nr:AAA family ATPase [Anaerolineales bacterium]
MTAPILATKLFVPSSRPDAVSRPRLAQQLNNCLGPDVAFRRKLTLVSAPAGFGKTTLIGNWLAAAELATAWLSLDARDADLTRFLTYLVAALQTAVPTLGQRALEMLEASPTSPVESVLTVLLNELAAVPHRLLLVLDDYHVVEEPDVDEALTF